MPIRKNLLKSGSVSWGYYFDLPGSTRADRKQVVEWGFETKAEAVKAEAKRRIEEDDKAQAAAKGITVLPRTLGQLIEEFLTQYADRGSLAATSAEAYRERAAYISADLLAMPVADLKPLHFTREWNRLKDSGGKDRRTKQPKPLSRKTVADIRVAVSSAFTWAVIQEHVESNPVKSSVLARGGSAKRVPVALTPEQQRLLLDGSMHWFLPDYLEVAAGLGSRRGELLALRWSDLREDQLRIGRSLCETKAKGLEFKEPKSPAGVRYITVPPSTLQAFERVRARQEKFREQYGPDYKRDLDLIFCHPDGSLMSPQSVSSATSDLCRRLKMPNGVSLHALRHTHGSQLLAAGVELPAVSRRLGHASPAITAQIYSHILDGRDRAAAEVWESFNAKSGTSPIHHQGKKRERKQKEGQMADTQNEQVRPN